MPSLQFLDTNGKPLLSGTKLYLWDSSALPGSNQFPSKTAPPPATCGTLDAGGRLQAFPGIQFDLPGGANVSIPQCKGGPVTIGASGFNAGILRTYSQLSGVEQQGVTADDVERFALSPTNPQLLSPMPPTPVVNLRFFVLSNAVLPEGRKSVFEFLFPQVSFLRSFWTPPTTGPTAKFLVNFQWDQNYAGIDDPEDAYKRIDFFISGSPQALSLVKANWNNPHFDADIPIFVCNAAWDEVEDTRGPPHDGLESGHTLSKLEPWFKGERAILLFMHSPDPETLAHEMSHWVGFHHKEAEALGANNVGQAHGGGTIVAPQQFAKLYRWATLRGLRRSMTVG